MKYVIGEKCIQCFACIRNRICPEEAIIERADVYSIDPEKCTACGHCFQIQQYFCPVRAILEQEESS